MSNATPPSPAEIRLIKIASPDPLVAAERAHRAFKRLCRVGGRPAVPPKRPCVGMGFASIAATATLPCATTLVAASNTTGGRRSAGSAMLMGLVPSTRSLVPHAAMTAPELQIARPIMFSSAAIIV